MPRKEIGAWGKRFVPGNGREHFCQPTAVAVLKDGSFFVADGYCNRRIVHFGANGNFLEEFSQGTNVDKLRDQILRWSHRENGRVVALATNGGRKLFEFGLPENFETVYSVDLNAEAKALFVVPGRVPNTAYSRPIKAFAVSSVTHKPLYSWAQRIETFVQPHVIRGSKDGSYVFIGETRPGGGVLWKFEIKRERVHQQMQHHHHQHHQQQQQQQQQHHTHHHHQHPGP